MPTSDYPFATQLHADRTARIHSEQRMLRVPAVRFPWRFARPARTATATATAKLATTC